MSKKPFSSKRKRTSKAARPEQVHELTITLKHSKPPIWRRIAVPSDMLLSDLHWVIQIAMGWTNSHLHQFIVRSNKPRPKIEDIRSMSLEKRWDKLTDFMQRDRFISDPQFELEDAEDERKVKLCELAPMVKSKFIYEYDFGDGWEHVIKTVKIGPPMENIDYPVCLKGKFACPPEDCGGIWGYYEMLEILEDPKNERYEEFLDWLDGDFDPEHFDIEQINSDLVDILKGKKYIVWELY